MSALYVGTSSWTFPDWPGVFYPSGLPTQEFLRFYATQFNSVEVNTSFYGLPRPSTILNWLDNVPNGFTFALKAPRFITHEQRLVDCQKETLVFLDVIRSLGMSAAPGLLQLPPSVTRRESGRAVAAFLDWLAGQLEGIRLAVEVRAHDLMTQAFAEFLAQRGMAMVLVDREGTPDLYPLWKPVLDRADSPGFTYIRLIGDDRNKPPTNRELCRPQEDRLALWSSWIAGMLEREIDVYAYVHNPYEGHSPATVRRLLERINALHPVPVWSPEPPARKPDDVSPNQLSLF
jgi:uncharacterized protein YecE (DUF72 family)